MELTTSHRRRFDPRRSPREPAGRLAHLEQGDGLPSRYCTVWDVSDGGARLVVHDPGTLPDEFILADGHDYTLKKRKCRIVWRGEAQVGVQFSDRSESAG